MDEWTIEYLWRWTGSLERLAILGLALMSARIVVVVVRVCYNYYSARHRQVVDTESATVQRNRKCLVAKLGLWVDSLKSIASTAPYLGLAGTCVGILYIFRGFIGSRASALLFVVTGINAAFLSTVAGLLVAIPATVTHNYLRTLVWRLEREIELSASSLARLRATRRFPLRERISNIQFAIVAVPMMALCIAGYMTFSSFHIPKGLRIGVASNLCEYEHDEKVIVLRLAADNKLFLNSEKEDWTSLPGSLSKIYSTRVDRTLYLFADDDVPFYSVAYAIDLVQNLPNKSEPVGIGSGNLNIKVRVMTSNARNARCVEPHLGGPGRHALK